MTVARVLVVQPAPHAPMGRLQEWWAAAGLQLDVVSPSEGDAVPTALDHDALVVMGGSMGANDDDAYPWLTDVKRLLADSSKNATPTLGVCLGHQLLAVACGGVVVPNPAGIQAGVQDVGLLGTAASDPLFGGLFEPVAVQWNHDLVVELPPGATLLASHGAGTVQAMRTGPLAWGVQFHPEVDIGVVRGWADRDVATGELAASDADALIAPLAERDSTLVRHWEPWADRFAALVIRHAASPRSRSAA